MFLLNCRKNFITLKASVPRWGYWKGNKGYFSRGWFLLCCDGCHCFWRPARQKHVRRERSEPSFEGNQQWKETEVVKELPILPHTSCSQSRQARIAPSCFGQPVFQQVEPGTDPFPSAPRGGLMVAPSAGRFSCCSLLLGSFSNLMQSLVPRSSTSPGAC